VSCRSATRPLNRSLKLVPPVLRERRASLRATNRRANEPFGSCLAVRLVLGRIVGFLAVRRTGHPGRHGVDLKTGFGIFRLAGSAVPGMLLLPSLFRLVRGFRLLNRIELGIDLSDLDHALLRLRRPLRPRHGKNLRGELAQLAAEQHVFFGARPGALELLLGLG